MLTFDPEAADRWKRLSISTDAYDGRVRAAIRGVLQRLDDSPGDHRIGAIQFLTEPTTWARVVDVGEGADWMVVWTVDPPGIIRILRIEPAPSM